MNKVIQKLKSVCWSQKLGDYLFPVLLTIILIYGAFLAVLQFRHHDICIQNGHQTSAVTVNGEVMCETKTIVKASTLPGYKE